MAPSSRLPAPCALQQPYQQQHVHRLLRSTACAAVCPGSRQLCSSCHPQLPLQPLQQQPLQSQGLQLVIPVICSSHSRHGRNCRVKAAGQAPPDPWQQVGPGPGPGQGQRNWPSSSSSGGGGAPPPPGGNGGSGGPWQGGPSPTSSYDPWDAAAPPAGVRSQPVNGGPRYEQTDWGWSGGSGSLYRLRLPVLPASCCTGCWRCGIKSLLQCLFGLSFPTASITWDFGVPGTERLGTCLVATECLGS